MSQRILALCTAFAIGCAPKYDPSLDSKPLGFKKAYRDIPFVSYQPDILTGEKPNQRTFRRILSTINIDPSFLQIVAEESKHPLTYQDLSLIELLAVSPTLYGRFKDRAALESHALPHIERTFQRFHQIPEIFLAPPQSYDPTQRMLASLTSLTLLRIELLQECLQRDSEKIQEIIRRDQADTRTEYGGFFKIQHDGTITPVQKNATIDERSSDGNYQFSFDRFFPPGLAPFHIHANEPKIVPSSMDILLAAEDHVDWVVLGSEEEKIHAFTYGGAPFYTP